MKKARFFFLFCALLLLGVNTSVNASVADYLPGGANYLNIENYSLSNNLFQNNEPFAIKPDTDYTLTIDDDYWHEYVQEPIIIVQITVYDNDDILQEMEFDFEDFSQTVNDFMAQSVQFHSAVNANHIDVFFYSSTTYFSSMGFSRTMLEEGTSFTSFEEYIQGTLLDTASPEFQNINQVISFVHQPISITDILSSLEAYDAIDGDVSSRIQVEEDLYTPSKTMLGEYPITISVTDNAGNTTQTTLYVEVVDILKPEFSSVEAISLPYPQTMTLDEISSLLHASDNYDGDITQNIYLVSDDYTSSKEIIGSYALVYGVSDSSGNEAFITIEIEVVDEQSPIISGTSSIIIGYDKVISEETIQSGISVIDNYDETIPLVIVYNDYTENHDIIGEYTVTFSAEDSSGNTSTFTVNIEVVDEIGPILYYDYSIVQTYQNYVLSLEEFIHLLALSNEFGDLDSANVRVLYDSYTLFAGTPGVYHLKLLINGQTEKDFQINVKESSDYVYLPLEDEPNFWNQNKQLIEILCGAITLILSGAITFIHFKKK